MYDDIDYRFNWGKLIIKVIIFVILIILAVLVVSKTISKNNENTINKNMTLFKEAAVEYFKEDKLPEKLNDTTKVSLKELIDEKITDKLTDENNKSCDVNKSYAEVTKLENNYELMLKLYCGGKSKIVKSILKNNNSCSGDNCSSKEPEKEESGENNSNATESTTTNNTVANNDNVGKNNSYDNSNVTTNIEVQKQTYYEYVKLDKVYSEWQLKKLTGDNVEKSKQKLSISNYCKLEDIEFYSTGYISKVIEPYTYTIKLLDIDKDTEYIKVLGKKHFDNDLSMYRIYLHNTKTGNPITTVKKNPSGAGVSISDVYSYRDSSLKSSNFDFSVSQPYKCEDGYYCTDITVKVKNIKNVEPYYASNLDKNIYFVPVHFYGQYADPNDCVIDTNDNAVAYTNYRIIDTYKDNVTVYRNYSYEKNYDDIKWSTESSLDGYVQTGKTELR